MKISDIVNGASMADMIAFVAVAVRNFAIGWELIAFFPNEAAQNAENVVSIGLIVMAIAIALNLWAFKWSKSKGGRE